MIFKILLFVILSTCQPKIIEKRIPLNQMMNGNFHYVGKFFTYPDANKFTQKNIQQKSFTVADFEVTFKISLYKYVDQGELTFNFGMFDYSHWHILPQELLCKDKFALAIKHYKIDVPTTGSTSEVWHGTIPLRPGNLYYFAVAQCDNQIIQKNFGDRYLTLLNVELGLFDRHHDGDMTPRLHFIFLVIAIIQLIFSYKRILRGPSVLKLILIAMILEVLHNSLSVVEAYTDNRFICVMQQLFQVESFHLICLCLSFIAMGSGINYGNYQYEDLNGLIGLVTGMINFFSVMIFHISDDQEDKFHNMYGSFGIVQLLIRLVISLYGLYGSYVLVEFDKKKNQVVCIIIAVVNIAFVVVQYVMLFTVESVIVLREQNYIVDLYLGIIQYFQMLLVVVLLTTNKFSYQRLINVLPD